MNLYFLFTPSASRKFFIAVLIVVLYSIGALSIVVGFLFVVSMLLMQAIFLL